jgi:hypothetical protein
LESSTQLVIPPVANAPGFRKNVVVLTDDETGTLGSANSTAPQA